MRSVQWNTVWRMHGLGGLAVAALLTATKLGAAQPGALPSSLPRSFAAPLGQGQPPAPSQAWAPAQPEAPREREPPQALRLVIDAEPTHLNPLLDPDLWGYRIAHDLVCEPLLRRRPERSGAADAGRLSAPEPALAAESELGQTQRTRQASTARIEPVLAERFRLASDGRSVDLWLRSGVHFHDGRPLTAQDVRATFDMVRTAGGSAPRTQALLADVLRVQAVGKDQIHIDLRRPARSTAAAIWTALSEIDILPAIHFPGGHLIHQPFNRKPVCTGPYRLAEWRRGSYVLLRRHPGYWGPPPPNEELRFRIATDAVQGLALLRQGEADVLGRVMPRYLADQVEPAVQRGRFRKVELDANQVVALLPNGRHPLLGQPAVRRALAQILEQERVRERLVRDVRKGLATPLRWPLLGAAQAAGSALPPAASALEDPATRASLASARLRLLMPAGASELQDAAKRIGEALARIGIKLDSEVVDLVTFTLRLRRGAFELALCAFSWTGDLEDFELAPLLDAVLPAGYALHGELLTAFAGLHDGTGAQHLVARLLSRWQEEAPLFLLYRPRQLVLESPQVGPVPQPLLGDFLHLRMLTKALRPSAAR